MSYEKKIKELMDRLAAMSPEPPPYPEETPMARPESRKSSPRPALVFATAAALVALLAVPLLLFTGEPDPVLGESTTTTSSTAPDTSTTTSTTEPATTTTEEMLLGEVSGVVFLYQTPENSFQGNPGLVPLEVTLTGRFEQDMDFFRAWQMFIEGREGLPGDLQNAVPAPVVVEGTTVEGGVIVAEMSDAFVDGASPAGLLADMTMLNQLIYTITFTDPGASVLFTVNGEPVEAFGTEGLDLTEPVSRETFREGQLHIINLTSPIVQQDDGRYLVEGIANVFEATVNIAVIDGDGEVVHEESVTATCGTGCWGEFSTGIDAEFIVPGESSIRVFTYSAEDGSVVDAITVPIPEGETWVYSVGG